MALLEAGYLVLAATLVQAMLAGGLLILRRSPCCGAAARATRGAGRVFAYFACIGLAFLFVEMAFLQKLLRFVHHPTVALALVLATFLLGRRRGQRCGRRDCRTPARTRRHLALAVAGIVGARCVCLRRVRSAACAVRPWPLAAKIGSSTALIAPLAFFMGMPFPLALRELEAPLVPWAWGINGCASVVSPVLATLLAVDLGFTAVLWLALAGYAIMPLIFPSAQSRERWLESMRNP